MKATHAITAALVALIAAAVVAIYGLWTSGDPELQRWAQMLLVAMAGGYIATRRR